MRELLSLQAPLGHDLRVMRLGVRVALAAPCARERGMIFVGGWGVVVPGEPAVPPGPFDPEPLLPGAPAAPEEPVVPGDEDGGFAAGLCTACATPPRTACALPLRTAVCPPSNGLPTTWLPTAGTAMTAATTTATSRARPRLGAGAARPPANAPASSAKPAVRHESHQPTWWMVSGDQSSVTSARSVGSQSGRRLSSSAEIRLTRSRRRRFESSGKTHSRVPA